MMSQAFYFFLLLHFFPTSTITAADPAAFTATELILLNCGADASSPPEDSSNRSWDSDDRSKYSPTNAAAVSSTSKAFYMDPSVFHVPYESARVFHSPFTYTFPITTGQKFLRLYFYPDTYSDYNTSQSFFSVTANDFTLFSNFSAFLYSRNTTRSFSKEFIINIDHSQTLRLTFSPNSNSFAFVNGIEIVSIPDKLYFQGNDVAIKYVDGNSVMNLENSTALENLYRLNVGGGRVEIQNDSGTIRGMFRVWSNDEEYILCGGCSYTPHREDVQIKYTLQTPSYSAPPTVYTSGRVTANFSRSLEWSFPVDSGFYYLLRFHFCEFTLDVTGQNQRVFTISINGQTAEIELDVIIKAGGPKIPIYLDYIKMIPSDGRRGKQGLRLSLIPMMEGNPKYKSALLNGLEIFKLSDKTGSLAAANPELTVDNSPKDAVGSPQLKKRSGGSSLIYAVVGSVIGAAALIVGVLVSMRRRKAKDSGTTSKSWVLLSLPSRSTRANGSGSGASLPSSLCRYFTLDEIKTATCYFNDNFVIGEGGFGKVYKGIIDDGATTVAIKRLKSLSCQGADEFLTEIKMLSKLRHINLVSLIGYCDAYDEMILVYDYMVHGTLRSHLYNSQHPPLPWMQRLQICIGTAKGLHYLHTGAEQLIIHRDVKTSNILLDEKWVAKISDFGLSKISASDHVSTVVKGSLGYVDPEYYRRRQLTEKSDVYSFGVVLFEVLCGRPAIVKNLPREQANLAEWAELSYLEGRIEQIVDANLNGQITPQCLNKFSETAAACVRGTGIERPSMNDVVWSLELAVRMQNEESEGGSSRDGDGSSFMKLSPSVQLHGSSATDEELFSGSKRSDFSAFSDKTNSLGRRD